MTKAYSFRITDIPRAIKALKKAGIENPRIELVLPNGTRMILTGQPETPPVASATAEDSVAS